MKYIKPNNRLIICESSEKDLSFLDRPFLSAYLLCTQLSCFRPCVPKILRKTMLHLKNKYYEKPPLKRSEK